MDAAGAAGRGLRGLLLTTDRAEGEALAIACRFRGVQLEVRRPDEAATTGVGDVLVLVLQGQAGEVLLEAGSLSSEAQRVVVIGETAASASLGGMTVEAWVDPSAGLDDLVGAICGANSRAPRATRQRADGLGELTAREREILTELLEGHGLEAMAQRLNISVNTVRTHLQNLFAKLGVTSQAEAAAVAIRHGLRPAAAWAEVPA